MADEKDPENPESPPPAPGQEPQYGEGGPPPEPENPPFDQGQPQYGGEPQYGEGAPPPEPENPSYDPGQPQYGEGAPPPEPQAPPFEPAPETPAEGYAPPPPEGAAPEPYASDPEAPLDPAPEPGATAPGEPALGSAEGAPDDDDLRGVNASRTDTFRQRTDEAAAKMRGAAEAAQEQTRVHIEGAKATISESEDRTIAIAGYVLMLAVGITGGLSALAALILAYAKTDTPDPVLASHFKFQIRTFWIGLATLVAGIVLTIVFIGVLVLIALVVWWLLRNVVGLIRLLEGKPISDPKAWLI